MGYKIKNPEYKTLIYSESSNQRLEILVDNIPIDCDYVKNVKFKDSVFENDCFTLGSAISSQFELEVSNEILDNILNFEVMEFIFHLEINEEREEVFSLGKYIFKAMENVSDDYTKFTVCDYMSKFDSEFDASEIVPCTRLQLVKAMCDFFCVELENETFLNSNAIVNVYDNSLKGTRYLSYISERAGGFAKINKETNKLLIKSFADVDSYKILCENGEFKSNELKMLTKIVYENATQKFENGNDEGDIIYLNSDSPFSCTQEEIDNIYTELNRLQYQTLDIRVWGDPSISAGDKIEVNGIKSFAQMEWSFGNGFYGKYKTKLEKFKKNSNVNKRSSNSKYKKLQSLLDEQNSKINILNSEVTENNEKINNLEITLDGTTQTVSKVEKTVDSITTTTQDSTGGNHLYIDEALETSVLEYTIEGKTEQVNVPPIENPSEIKTIPSIKNEFNIETDSFSTLGISFEFDKSKIVLNGTSTSSGNTIIKSKTKLSKGIYTVSFWKLGGSYEKNNYDFQLFIQGSEGTDKRFANITGTRLENGENKKTTITLEEETEIYLYFYCSGAELVLNNYEIGIQIEKGSISHEYRPFGNYAKVRVTGKNQFNLKTVSKMGYSYDLPSGTTNYIEINNFDKNNLSFSITGNGYVYILTNTHFLKPNTEYILSYNRENNDYSSSSNTRYYIYNIDENGNYALNQNSTDSDGNKTYLFTTNTTGMIAFAWGGDNKCSGASSVISNIILLEKVGEAESIVYEPSEEKEVLIDLQGNELCSNDLLKIENGQVNLRKEIDKIVLNGTENWGYNNENFYINGTGYKTYSNNGKCTSSHYLYKFQEDKGIWIGNSNFILIRDSSFTNLSDFKNWLSQNHLTVYYELEEPQAIRLKDIDISLFEGFNHVELVDDIETTTSIKFLRKTPLSDDYVVQPQLSTTNKNLANTTDKANQNSSDINATNTNLNNNFYNKNQINEMQTTTNQNITQVRNTVETLTTSTEYKINAINETITNGVPLVKTTSTSFGEDGWSMEKSGEEMSSNWNWEGFEVVKDKGKSTEEKTLVANSNGVMMNNTETKNRYIQKPIMIEKGTSISDGKSVGLCHYYIGE